MAYGGALGIQLSGWVTSDVPSSKKWGYCDLGNYFKSKFTSQENSRLLTPKKAWVNLPRQHKKWPMSIWKAVCSDLVQWQIDLDSRLTVRDESIRCQVTFINLPLSFSSPSLKVSPVSVMSLTVTECVRSLSGIPAFRTAVTLHLWATQISGHLPRLRLTRIPTTVPHTLPLESLRLPRYQAWTAEHIKDFQMTINLMLAAGCMSKQIGCFNRDE